MTTPIDTILDAAEWALVPHTPSTQGLPYVTHKATLSLMNFPMTCYRLNTGERVFDVADVERFLTHDFSRFPVAAVEPDSTRAGA